jgi:hypothetical protein
MALALFFVRRASPHGAPVVLAIGTLAGAVVFAATWLLLPGGAAAILELVEDVRSAVFRKRQPLVPPPEPAVAGEATIS